MKRFFDFIVALCISFLGYGIFIIYPTVGIDTEAAILGYDELILSWRTISRTGLSLIKEIFFPTYNQLLNNVLAIVFMALLVWIISQLLKLDIWVLSFVFVFMPFTYSQMYFQMQSFEVILGSIIVLVSVYLLLNINYYLVFITVFLTGFSISIYQSIFDYLLACSALFLLIKKEIVIKDFIFSSINIVGAFLVYWILNNVINSVPQSAYLTFEPFNLYSTRAIVYSLIMLIICIILYMSKRIDLFKAISLYIFLSSPVFTLVLTGSWKFRAMFPCGPFVLAIVLAYFVKNYKNLFVKFSSVLVILSCIMFTSYFEWKEIVRYNNDIEIAKKIISQIPSENYRVQFVGKYISGKTVFNAFTEPAGISFFAWDPVPHQSRSDHMLQLVGGKFNVSTPEQNAIASEKYSTVPNFMETGRVYIDKNEKVVVVRFS